MRILKCSAAIVAALAVIAVVYGQSIGRADKTITASASAKAGQKTVKKSVSRTPEKSMRRVFTSRSSNPISALGQSPQDQAEEEAAFAPVNGFMKQAKALSDSGDLAGAEQAYLNALDAAPVIQGRTQHVPFAALLLGQTYLEDGKYDKAVYWLSGAKKTTSTVGGRLDLDLALAYVRSGDYANAKSHYSDQAIMQYHSGSKKLLPEDLPGTDTPQALEASILLARGEDAYLEHRRDDALVDFQEAHRLAPDNAMIAGHCGELLSTSGHGAEAVPLLEQAATGRGPIAEDAKRWLSGIPASVVAAHTTIKTTNTAQ